MIPPPLTLAARLLQTPGGLDDVSEALSSGRELPVAPLLIGAGLLLVLLAVHSLRTRGRAARGAAHREPGGPSPLLLAWRICHARRVSWPGRLLLVRIARRSALPDVLPLLAASGTLYHHGRQFAAGLPVQRRRRVLRGVSRLQRELFAEGRPVPPPPDKPAPSAAPPRDRRARPRPAPGPAAGLL